MTDVRGHLWIDGSINVFYAMGSRGPSLGGTSIPSSLDVPMLVGVSRLYRGQFSAVGAIPTRRIRGSDRAILRHFWPKLWFLRPVRGRGAGVPPCSRSVLGVCLSPLFGNGDQGAVGPGAWHLLVMCTAAQIAGLTAGVI